MRKSGKNLDFMGEKCPVPNYRVLGLEIASHFNGRFTLRACMSASNPAGGKEMAKIIALQYFIGFLGKEKLMIRHFSYFFCAMISFLCLRLSC